MQNSTYRIINDGEEIKKIFQAVCYVRYRGANFAEALKYFIKKSGIAEECAFLFFQDDLDDYDQTEIPYPLDDKHVLLEFMVAGEGCSVVAYVDFSTLYQYACDQAAYEMGKDPSLDFRPLLEELRQSLLGD